MLCEECEKTFSLRGEDLGEFLRSVKDEKETEKGAECSNLGEETPAAPNGAPSKLSPTLTEEDTNEGPGTEQPVEKDHEPVSKRHKLGTPPSAPLHPTCCPQVACVACLGLLEQQYIQHLASAIAQHVNQRGVVGMETYCLAIHVPISLSIRRIGMEKCVEKCNFSKLTLSRDAMAGSCDTTTGSCDATAGDSSIAVSHDHTTESHDHVSTSDYVKESLKWQLRNVLESALTPLKCDYESPVMISLNLDHRSALRDCIGVKKLHPKLFPRPRKQWRKKSQPTPITRLPIERALKDLTEADLLKEGYFLSPIESPCSHVIEIQHKSVYVAGRYNKFSRNLPQTPWMVDGVRKADTSVQELICPQIVEAFRASDVKFSSSGREDVDVLMLGDGRPFLLELVSPRDVTISNADLQRIETGINASTKLVAVRQLVRVDKDSSTLLKQGEEEKKKIYSALVWTEGELTPERLDLLDGSTNLLLKQKTPIRVLHRRTLAVREKVIYSMKTQLLDSHHVKLRLVTQAGTYIKEFVHGDFGRSQPNLGMLLGCNADILKLDVLEVQLQWPPMK